MKRIFPALVAVLAVVSAAGRLPAQEGVDGRFGGAGLPAWMSAWSPTAPLASSSRTLPAAPALPNLLGAPAPRVGLLWTAGNPAGLALELDDTWGDLTLGAAGASGAYRRPLDRDGVTTVGLAGSRWQPTGEHSSVIGRVLINQTNSEFGSFSPQAEPFGADPFVLTDTSTSAMQRIAARLEGGFGWRRGGWGIGAAAGFEVIDNRTRESSLARLTRSSRPGVSLGVARVFGDALRLSAYGRWRGDDETVRFIAWPALGLIRPLQGLSEPPELPIGGDPSRLEFFRFAESDAFSGGLAAAGRLSGAEWTFFGEQVHREVRHFRDRREDAPADRWESQGWRAGAGLSRLFRGAGVHTMLRGEYSSLEGDAFRSDLDGAIYRSAADVLQAALDLRWRPAGSVWLLAARLDVRGERRERSDFLAEVGTDLVSWRPAASLEVGRRIGSTTLLSLAGGLGFYEPKATLLNPTAMGPVYRQVMGPELALYAARSRPTVAGLTLRHALEDGVAVLLEARGNRVAALQDVTVVPLLPEGERTQWAVELRVVWDGEE